MSGWKAVQLPGKLSWEQALRSRLCERRGGLRRLHVRCYQDGRLAEPRDKEAGGWRAGPWGRGEAEQSASFSYSDNIPEG